MANKTKQRPRKKKRETKKQQKTKEQKNEARGLDNKTIEKSPLFLVFFYFHYFFSCHIFPFWEGREEERQKNQDLPFCFYSFERVCPPPKKKCCYCKFLGGKDVVVFFLLLLLLLFVEGGGGGDKKWFCNNNSKLRGRNKK